MRRLLATLEILRPHNMIAAGACVGASYYLCGGRDLGPVVWPALFTAIVTGLGNLVNDFFDADIDRVNKPHRPIPSGRLSRDYVIRVYETGTVLVTLLMIIALPPAILALMAAWEVLLFVYAIKAKRVALVGNVLIAAICASAFLVGAMVTGALGTVAFPLFFAFVFVLAREFVKGAEDVEGDRTAGAQTLAVRCGAARTAQWGAMILFVGALAAPVPALVRYFGGTYGVLMELLVVPGMISAAYLVLGSPHKAVFGRVSWLLKIEMLAGIVVMGLGRV
jgi:geranylgeranylglycerol-phosphate geranylgeranyltransferase